MVLQFVGILGFVILVLVTVENCTVQHNHVFRSRREGAFAGRYGTAGGHEAGEPLLGRKLLVRFS